MLNIISLGSNLGNRLSYLQLAIDQINILPSTAVTKISSVYETEPQQYLEQPNFLNAVIEVETELSPQVFLKKLKEIEQLANRERIIENGPRTLDLDIVVSSFGAINDSDIELPHPRAQFRGFVLLPWLEIDPTAELNSLGAVSKLAATLEDQGVRKLSDLRLK